MELALCKNSNSSFELSFLGDAIDPPKINYLKL